LRASTVVEAKMTYAAAACSPPCHRRRSEQRSILETRRAFMLSKIISWLAEAYPNHAHATAMPATSGEH
jgi:hypothetical protein